MKKMLSCFILFSTFFSASFAKAQVTCTDNGSGYSCTGSYSGWSMFGGGIYDTGGTGIPLMNQPQVANSRMLSDPSYIRGVCLAAAAEVGKKCDAAYATLQPVCSALTGYFGAKLGAAFWERALGTTIDQKAVEAMKNGGALSGYSKDDAMINCTWLTSQANAYCANGVEKLKAKCN